MTGYDPYAHAEALGINVVYGTIRTANGLWLPDHNTIVLRRGLRAYHERAALTHEIGHAIHGHRISTPRTELQADRFAASKLINPARLEDVMRTTPDTGAWCLELGVTHRILDTYLRHLRSA